MRNTTFGLAFGTLGGVLPVQEGGVGQAARASGATTPPHAAQEEW